MKIVSCVAPLGPLEPAPLSSLFIDMGADRSAAESSSRAFWGADDEYYVQVSGKQGGGAGVETWYSIDSETTLAESSDLDEAEIEELGRQLSGVIPLRAGRIAFPVGLGGKSIYRMWRTKTSVGNGAQNSRIRIQAVRAGRSLRRLA